MVLQITVKDISGNPIQGVEVKYWRPNSFFPIDTQTTNANGIVTIKNDTWTSGWYYTFTKSTEVCPFKLAYGDVNILPTFYNVTLSPAILYFRLYKYNEATKAEELYKQSIKVEPYNYINGNMIAETATSSLSINSDGYYYIDLRDHSVSHLIEYTSSYLFKITANGLTNYGSIFLLPDGFIKKEITDWDTFFFGIKINGNTLPSQTMVFYPNTKRLTKAELRKCVVSNPHLMEDAKDDTYCPTNITYSTIYNMIKDSNNRDNNYIGGVEDINFYQNKTLTINSNIPIKISIDAPGYAKPPRNNAVSPTSPFSTGIYYSADAKIKASVVDSDYELTNNERSISMSTDQTVTFEGKMKPYTFVIKRIQLDTAVVDCSTGEFAEFMSAYLSGYWKGSVAPSSAITQNLQIAISITDTIGGGFVSFTHSIKDADGTTATEPLDGIKYESFSETINTGGALNWLNRDDFIVSCVFLSNPDVFWEFEGNNYYTNNAFHPVITSNCSTGGGTTPGTSWAGGKYSVAIIPNNKMVRVSATDKNGKNQDFDITSPQTVSANSMNIVGAGIWTYNSPKMTATDSDTLGIPYNGDTSTSNITVRFS